MVYVGVHMSKTEDGYKVKEDDLVWCVSDPFTITAITMIHLSPLDDVWTFWLDPGDGEGDYPANNHEVFKYQRNCLLAARRIAYENIQCCEYSTQTHTEEIKSIDDFLDGMD